MFRALLFGLLIPYVLLGQVRSGLIITDTGQPLDQCIITGPDGWAISDASGEFHLDPHWIAGDTLMIQRIGYETTTYILAGDPVRISLRTQPLGFLDIESYGRGKLSSTDESLTISPEAASSGLQWNRWVESIPAMQLKSYGGPAGVLTLSMDGGPATHLKLLIDGFELTNPQNGLTDMSQLPLALISTLNYTPAGSGPSSISSDGALHLRTQPSRSQVRYSTGSYGHQSWSGATFFRYHTIRTSFHLGRRKDRGDFPVTYREQTGKRTNNDFSQNFLQWSLQRIRNSKQSSRLFGLWTDQRRGVAGLIYSPSKGRHNDRLLLTGWERTSITRKGIRRIQLSYQVNQDRYNDSDLRLHSRHDNRKAAVKWISRLKLNPIGIITNKIELEDQRIRSTDAGRQRRRTGLGFSRWDSPEDRRFHLSFSGSVLSADQYRPEFQNQVSAGFDFLPRFHFNLRLIRGKEVRIPTFNELYWSPGGNPNLRPEHTEFTQLELSSTSNVLGSFRGLAFSKTSRDLIQWTPRGALWQPVNIQKVTRTGWKIFWTRTEPFRHFIPSLSYGAVTAINLSPGEAHQKQLPYVPVHTWSTALTWTNDDLRITINQRFRGTLISRYDWPRDIRLPGVLLRDLTIEKTWALHRVTLSTGFNVDNITDESYETVQGYPEPGRSVLFTLTLQPNQEK